LKRLRGLARARWHAGCLITHGAGAVLPLRRRAPIVRSLWLNSFDQHWWQPREDFYLPDARATHAQNKTKVFVCAFLTVTSSGPHACARVHTGDRTKVGGFSPLLLLRCRVVVAQLSCIYAETKCVPRSLLTCYAQKASYFGAAWICYAVLSSRRGATQ
jgi:hypothetical protein